MYPESAIIKIAQLDGDNYKMRTTEKLLTFIGNGGSDVTYDYYVDQVNGNDSNDGKTLTTPWKTMSKLSGATFTAGQKIGLKRGCVWRENWTLASGGSAGNPVTYGAYGSGPMPKISAAEQLSTSWTFSNITAPGLFYDNFEANNKTKWSAIVNDSVEIATSAGAALVGTYGLGININSVTARYLRDDTPADEKVFRCRFYIDPNTLTMGAADEFLILQARRTTVAGDAYLVKLKRASGQYNIFVYANADSGSIGSGTYPITDAPHYVEINWAAATTAGANNGIFQVYIDGVNQINVTNGDNDTWSVGEVRFGATGEVDATTSGTFYLDAYYSNNTGVLIGPTDPVSSIYQATYAESAAVLGVSVDDTHLTLQSTLSAVTSAGNFYHDSVADILYVWAPASDNPGLHTIEIGVRGNAALIASKSYITFNDIWFHGSGGSSGASMKIAPSTATTTTEIKFNRCRMSHAAYYGCFVTYRTGTPALTNITFNGCELDHNGRIGLFIEGENVSNRVTGMLVTGCLIHDNGNALYGMYGMHTRWHDGTTVTRSRLYNNNGYLNWSGELYMTESINSMVSYNVTYGGNRTGIHFDVHSNMFTCIYNICYNQGKNGIWVEEHLRAAGTSVIYGNTTYACENGLVFNPGGTEFVVSGVTVKNNLFAFSTICSVQINDNNVGANCLDNTLDYNVYWPDTTNPKYTSDFRAQNPRVTLTFAQWKTYTSWDANSIQVNPLLSNIAAYDFTLTASSPARNFGPNLGAQYQNAYNGTQGVGNWDAGAYIYV